MEVQLLSRSVKAMRAVQHGEQSWLFAALPTEDLSVVAYETLVPSQRERALFDHVLHGLADGIGHESLSGFAFGDQPKTGACACWRARVCSTS